MQLSLQFFEQIAGALKSDAITTRDKRLEPRVGIRIRAKITPIVIDDRGQRPVDVWIRDVSVGGIGLTTQKALPRGSLFVIALPGDNAAGVSLQYRVTNVNTVNSGTVVIGAVFQQVLSADRNWEKGPLRLLGTRKIKKPGVVATPVAA